ncbi:sulfate adenylyltransferase subunit 2 [bacterium]|nr:sulfate adenylyltransferase subunit 2 [bacterium]
MLALKSLENEAIYLLREAIGQLERPALLFSGGKDSIVMAHLLGKAFAPGPLPCPLLHIDTGHNFPETLDFRDRFAQQIGAQLLVRHVEQSIQSGRVAEESGPRPSRNTAQTVTLLDAIQELSLDGLLGGARRDEEKARAKERFFSHRDRSGQWDPKNQRPECWNLINGLKHPGEHFRIFPLSNWTELDIWRYIQAQQIEVPCLYFAHQRQVIHTQGMLLAQCPWVQPLAGEESRETQVRFRTIGDMTCTGAVPSTASNLAEILAEIGQSRRSERGTRADDQRSEAAMEDRKRLGYF